MALCGRALPVLLLLLAAWMPPEAAAVDFEWHAPPQSCINNLTSALRGSGVYGFIYNSSATPDGRYGTYNWCNMAHVRRAEYVRPGAEFELQYVELIHRHHKRTPYASNAFPVEPYRWDCDDARLFLYGQPLDGPAASRVYRRGYSSAVNPFTPSGWVGDCAFPQITGEGLADSWQHGADLYDVYHDLLGLLPGRDDADFASAVRYRVTNNAITSQVGGMVVGGTWRTADAVPLMVQAEGIDSLEPQYRCRAASNLFDAIKSDSNPLWRRHLEAAAGLFRALDDISGVAPDDAGFHASLDHYYDNLSARQCHGKPLPCKPSSSACVTQALADAVYRLGNWEYSHVYRDHPSSLAVSAASLGVWVGELTTHLRDVMAGSTNVVYFHNIAHDGSVSRLLSILQLDQMVWPGMGSEVVFELYRRRHDDHGGYLLRRDPPESSPVAPTRGLSSSACPSCPTSKSKGTFYLRVLFGGRVLTSSNPTLGLMDMVPVETVLEYLDGLVGKGADKVRSRCQA